MQITKHIYKRIQAELPDLFVEAEKAKSTSTLFAEFLPATALSNPSGNPWGQYGNREIPLKRKTIVISFKELENKPFSELEAMDEVARFLKRAGFDVLIPVGDELQDYDMQLFDRAHISEVGNKSRAEMQRLAIEKKISADELFFIDDVKKELNEQHAQTLRDKLKMVVDHNVLCDRYKENFKEIWSKESYCNIEKYFKEIDDLSTEKCADESRIQSLMFSIPLNKTIDALTKKNSKKIRFQRNLETWISLIKLTRTGIPLDTLINADSNILNLILSHADEIIEVMDASLDRKSLNEDLFSDDLINEEIFPDLFKFITDIFEIYKDHRNTLYYVRFEYTPTEEKISDLVASANTLEGMESDQFSYISGKLPEGAFNELVTFTCDVDTGNFVLKAPKLRSLKLTLNPETETSLSLKDLPLLNRLEIDCRLYDARMREPLKIETNTNRNLVELCIYGNIDSLEFIQELLEKSPNLKLLELKQTAVSKEMINRLSKSFPRLSINILSKFPASEYPHSDPTENLDFLSSEDAREETAEKKGLVPPHPATLLDVHAGHESPETDVVYTAASREKHLTLDFDTKHDPEITFTMQHASKHLTSSKPNRFGYTRDGIYQLDVNSLFTPIEANVQFHYPLPEKNEKLPTGDQHDFYEFKNTLNLKPGETYRLTALSAQDVLFQLKLNGKSLTAEAVDITKDNVGFYYLKAKTPLHGQLTYILDVPAENKEVWRNIPAAAQEIIQTIQNFPSVEVDALLVADAASAAEKLDAMYNQRKAACRHRVAIFLHKLKKLKLEDPEGYAHIEARGVARGGVHADIEISVDSGNTWEALELGGYEAKEQYTSITLPPMPFSSKKSVDAPKPNFQDVMIGVEKSQGQNTLLCLKDSSDIYHCLSHIRHTCQGRPIFYVDSPEQLRTSLRRLKLDKDKKECEMVEPPAGLLHNFLMAPQNADPPPVIIINWENFKLADMVQFNSVIDVDHRRVDTTPIPNGATIVGLHSRNEKMMDLLGDSAFVSRHATGGIHDFTTQTLSQQKSDSGAAEAAVGGVLKINLHQSPRWHDILVGKPYVDGDKLRWQDGQLLQLLEDAGVTHVELINPPVTDREFNNFVADLRAGLPITLLNQQISLGRKLNVNISDKPSFTQDVIITLARVDHLIKDAYIINSATFEQCLHNKIINDDGLMLAGKGLLHAHENKTLTLCLCDNLSESQWSFMLEQARKYNVTLTISVLPDVTIPPQIQVQEVEVAPAVIEKSPNRFIITDDVEYSVTQVQRELATPAKVIDLSEASIDDLFCKVGYSIEPKGFRFTKRDSTIWRALQAGETVILKGYCSVDMLNFLSSMMSPSPYFALEGQRHTFPGKLIIVADSASKPPAWLNAEIQAVTIAQKKEALGLAQDDQAQDKPFIQLAQSKKQAQVPALNLAKSAPENLSLEACEQFEKNHLLAVKHILRFSPYALLEGPPGVGKSYFMRVFASDRSVRIYRENDIEKWATEAVPPGVQKILFRDEINLRGIDCSQDRDLLNDPPSIFVNGKYYRVADNCKIMYAQNPLDYGGDRHEPKLFEDLPDCKYTFDQMSKAFVLHRILKPIFETTFDAAESLMRAKKIIQDNFATMRSIRDLQTKAIFECAEKGIADPVNRRMICVGHNDFIVTPSRYKPYRDVLTLLQARTFKRALPADAPDGAKYNGANGLVLQGPPGVGKSEFIEHILNDEGYAEVDSKTTAEQIESGKVYYRLRASVSNEQKLKILHEAFQKGAILIIDEIDSCPLLEDYLNAYLVGEDIHGKRAEKPGFTICSTANGAAMKGRRMLPAPLKSRMLALEFDEYPRDDLIQILSAKFIPPVDPNAAQSSASIARQSIGKDMIAFMVDEFLTQQNTQQYDTPPTFRDLYIVAKDYFEHKFDHYDEKELSKSQHQFMLCFRDHPRMQSLQEQFSSGELDPKKMTLSDMEKKLKTPDSQYTLFQAAKNADANSSPDSSDSDQSPNRRH